MSDPNQPNDQPVVPPLPDAGPQQASAPSQPPYAQQGQSPAYTAPTPPPAGRPYGQPGAPVPPSAGGPYGAPSSPAPAQGGKGLAITALVVAIIGFIAACIPFVTFGSWLLIIAAVVLAIIALVKKLQGKGMSITAIVIAGVSALISIVMMLLTPVIAALIALDGIEDGFPDDGPGIPVPGEEGGEQEPGTGAQEPAEGSGDIDLEIIEEQIWEDENFTNFALVIENASEDQVYADVYVTVEALDEDGTILESMPDYITALPGESLVDGMFVDTSADDIAELNVVFDDVLSDGPQPLDDFGALDATDPEVETDDIGWTTATGTVTSTFEDDLESVEVAVVVRNSDGQIVTLRGDYIERLPGGGSAEYTVDLYEELPSGATYEVYVSPRL